MHRTGNNAFGRPQDSNRHSRCSELRWHHGRPGRRPPTSRQGTTPGYLDFPVFEIYSKGIETELVPPPYSPIPALTSFRDHRFTAGAWRSPRRPAPGQALADGNWCMSTRSNSQSFLCVLLPEATLYNRVLRGNRLKCVLTSLVTSSQCSCLHSLRVDPRSRKRSRRSR